MTIKQDVPICRFMGKKLFPQPFYEHRRLYNAYAPPPNSTAAIEAKWYGRPYRYCNSVKSATRIPPAKAMISVPRMASSTSVCAERAARAHKKKNVTAMMQETVGRSLICFGFVSSNLQPAKAPRLLFRHAHVQNLSPVSHRPNSKKGRSRWFVHRSFRVFLLGNSCTTMSESALRRIRVARIPLW